MVSRMLLWTRGVFVVCVLVWAAVWIAFGITIYQQEKVAPLFHETISQSTSLTPTPPASATTRTYATYPQRYPVTSFQPLPTPDGSRIPRVQSDQPAEDDAQRATRLKRRDEVKQTFKRGWDAYRERAWGKSELSPVVGGPRDTYGGWAVMIVDCLDSLWILGLEEEFREAVDFAIGIDFNTIPMGSVSTFESTIRYLAGFLAAYDLSADKRLLEKAIEVATVLYTAFDTPNHMSVPMVNIAFVQEGGEQIAEEVDTIAGLGSFTLEYIRLAQLTGDDKWYDAPRRIMEAFAEAQNKTRLPGMWPAKPINARTVDFSSGSGYFHLGGNSDSCYEYLLKAHLLLGGSDFYLDMYEQAAKVITQKLLYRPMLPSNAVVLLPGLASVDDDGQFNLMHRVDHLACFAGGLISIGGKVLGEREHVELGGKMTRGCVEMYATSPLGIMPDEAFVVPCTNCSVNARNDCCAWDEGSWLEECGKLADDADPAGCPGRVQTGILSVQNAEFKLRPEALESVLMYYRTTGDAMMPELAWNMFEKIREHTRTDVANAALLNVMDSSAPKKDEMESFWFAETLKYLYLIYSDFDTISLDDWVFNTEAHPLRRPLSTGRG
ncbi:Mannosyl-oligosaccharide 1,2-alpha-mannosidase IC [Sphaceloma murrayae]|uniref:alpha-1,2-Mannosidase n=1 Tax=Sphaceloma murrayae TaxID=2082308 RepID=A0A2K1QHU6_9PEZI|nr:Mannosyl-oligosaccharide 1,2-alpha-mannosidase IC [Sphaceloma murrayae]